MTTPRHNKIYELYNGHAQRCAPDDFWGQVKRSINGQPVDESQITMIVEAIIEGLELRGDDILLDLCCGNGVLSDILFNYCNGGLGVDFAEYLVTVAQQHFALAPERQFIVGDVEEFVSTSADVERFTKALCYGSFLYLSDLTASTVLRMLHDRFPNVERVFLGNLPDKSRITNFYYDSAYQPGVENDHESLLGAWRTADEITQLARDSGWNAEFHLMPESFYAAHYRFDAILTRQ